MKIKQFMNKFRSPLKLSFFSDEVRLDPYPFYQYLRENAPVHYFPNDQCWALSRYEDVSYALKHPELYSSKGIVPFENQTLIGEDPPNHTEIRKKVMPAFTARRMAELESFIAEQTNLLIDQWKGKQTVNFVESLASPLPMRVISEIVGIDPAGMKDYMIWSDAASGVKIKTFSQEATRTYEKKFHDFFEAHFSQMMESPKDCILNDALFDKNNRMSVSLQEAANMGKLILVGGYETTTNLLTNAMVNLLKFPDEFALVRNNPELIPQMLEEVLRYESPTQFVQRYTTQAITIDNVTIPAGAQVFLLIGAANRDAEVFPDPDTFSVNRNTRKHIAFGAGPHYCFGLHLSRLEARIACNILFSRIADFQLVPDQPQKRHDTVQVRGLRELKLKIFHN